VTVRKMLNELARKGALRRTHGGAVSLSVPVRETDLRTKEKTNIRQKRAIARAAFDLIKDYESVFLDAGSTTIELARLIGNGGKRNVTVITNALNIALALLDSPDIAVVVAGGQLRHDVGSCVGPLAEQAVGSLSFDTAFIGANNVSLEHGATTPQIVEVQFKRVAARAAARRFLLCDSSKFSGASMMKICPLEEFSAVITDSDLSPAVRNDLNQAGIPLILADVQKKESEA
ncbi:MAG: DeoR/GlpR family DNA-binding transcription regulator, partial [Candidatus Accumulibacter sp.]|nr:DeoR/GlpR family DNA-binding transcription regulator [Accumulibacter sp.]